MMKIYNSLTRKKEEFVPLNNDLVTIYNCGLTVYDYAHIGNLRSFTMADIIRRSIEFIGYKVCQVQNFTDVGHLTTDGDSGDDKLEKGALRTGKTVWEVAQFYIDAAMKDFSSMNFIEPEYRPRATDNIKEQIEMISKLFSNGYAYETSNAVYFDTLKFKDYGKLTGQNLEDKMKTVREEVKDDPEKRNPYDFRLWQKAIGEHSNHSMKWESPWGIGFPGWHIECSAMAIKYLGETIDIHTGGVDHIPVHHTNEIAQSEGATDKNFANYWCHNEFLQVDGKKMSKSLGNFFTLSQLQEKGYSPMHLKYFFYSANFRKIQNFTFEGLDFAKVSYDKLKVTLQKLDKPNSLIEVTNDKYFLLFKAAVEDSFNIPVAVSIVWNVVNSNYSSELKYSLIDRFDQVLGLKLLSE